MDPSSTGTYYSFPVMPFPWPENFKCGDIYINQRATQDVVLYTTYQAEIAVPESMINVGATLNSTTEALSLVFTKPKWREVDRASGNVTRKFVPLGRNLNFTTDPEPNPYIEYLGRPTDITPSRLTSTHLTCTEPYHLLVLTAPDATSIGDIVDNLWHYNLYGAQGPDFVLRLYTEASMIQAGARNYDMQEQMTGPACAQPLAQSEVFQLCDASGKNVSEWEGASKKNCTGFNQTRYWDLDGQTDADFKDGVAFRLETVCEAKKGAGEGGGEQGGDEKNGTESQGGETKGGGQSNGQTDKSWARKGREQNGVLAGLVVGMMVWASLGWAFGLAL